MNPYTLLFYLSPKSSYRPTLISQDEVFCSPDEIDQVGEGGVETLQTPVGEFAIEQTLDRLPAGKEPELVVVKTDASGRLLPRGLDRLRCPKALVLGDTHHFRRPLAYLLEYAQRERFDVILSDHDRHHLHFFRRAGFANVFWIPALNYCLRPRPLTRQALPQAVFVGQTGAHHPYRRDLLAWLGQQGLPVVSRVAPSDEAATLYAKSAISLNCSLNGDLNLRVFEVIGSRGLLLTDRICSESGLYQLFEEGREFLCYDSPADLREKVASYLRDEERAMAIRMAGHEKLRLRHTPSIKRRQLMDLVFNGRVDPDLRLDGGRFISLAGRPSDVLSEDVRLYEYMQSLHLQAGRLTVYAAPCQLERLQALGDLPRLQLKDWSQCGEDWQDSHDLGLPEERLLIASADPGLEAALQSYAGLALYVLEGVADQNDLAGELERWGYRRIDDEAPVWAQSELLQAAQRWHTAGLQRAPQRALESLSHAELAPDRLILAAQTGAAAGRLDLCAHFLERCLAQDRSLADVYLALGDIHEQEGNLEEAGLLYGEGYRRDRASDAGLVAWKSVRDRLPRTTAEWDSYCRRVGFAQSPSKLDRPSRILVYTNLFPPQELGGYGRKMWEFSYELKRRGHEILVLAGDARYLAKPAEGEEAALEGCARRSLTLFGRWADGKAELVGDGSAIRRAMEANRLEARRAIREFRPDCCLMGNLDLLGHYAIEELTGRGVPVIQCMGNYMTGWMKGFVPDERWFRPGPASAFLTGELRRQGFDLRHPVVLYPGARLDRFYRHRMPSRDFPRIAFAGLLMAYKGPHVLVEALCQLARAGIAFEATIAGDSTDHAYVGKLKAKVASAGLSDRIRFPGFLNRDELERLFDRCNILAFPSLFDEPFGISHVEAMAAGLTVLTSGRGGSPEIVRDGIDGLHFDGDDPADLARKIAWLVSEPEQWQRLALAGRERASSFSIPATVDRIEEVFKEIGQGDGSPPARCETIAASEAGCR